MTKQSLKMMSRSWRCSVCGTVNDGLSTCCFRCGHPGLISQSQHQTRRPLSPARRTLLIGGLVAGAALLGGGGVWFTKQVLPGWARPISPTIEIQLDSGYLPSPALAWSPDGLSIACSAVFDTESQEGVIVVDTKKGQKQWTYWDSAFGLSALAWSPDGRVLALAGQHFHSSPTPRPVVQLWQVQGWRQLAQYSSVSENLSDKMGFQQLVWSPDQSRLAVIVLNERTSAQSIQIWSMSNGQVLFSRQIPASPNSFPFLICWLPDSKTLATSGLEGEVDIWNIDSGRSVFHHVPDHPLGDNPQDPLIFAGPGAAMSPDRKQVALYTLEGGQPIIQVWDIATEKLLFRCQPVAGQQGGLTWSPNGHYLAAYKNDHGQNMIHVWDAESGALSVTYGALYDPGMLTWSPDSRFLALVDRRQPFFLHAPAHDTVLRIFPVG